MTAAPISLVYIFLCGHSTTLTLTLLWCCCTQDLRHLSNFWIKAHTVRISRFTVVICFAINLFYTMLVLSIDIEFLLQC